MNDRYGERLLKCERSIQVVTLLLKNGADPNVENDEGNTALLQAVLFANSEIVKSLINSGADTGKCNKGGDSIKSFAKIFEEPEILSLVATI